MHKKGITEEVAKKRSRRTVKHQRGVAGLDMAAILAKRNQSEQVRAKVRSDAVAKAKEVKKAKEAKKEKSKVRLYFIFILFFRVDARWPDQLTAITVFFSSSLLPTHIRWTNSDCSPNVCDRSENFEAASEGCWRPSRGTILT